MSVPLARITGLAAVLGAGAAMVGGVAIAAADTGTDTAGVSSASVSATSGPAVSNRRAARESRINVGSAAVRRVRVASPAAVALASRVARRSAASVAPIVVEPAAESAPIAVVNVDPFYKPPFIPDAIVPGAHVTKAVGEIAAGQASLHQTTWGAGDLAAGIAAIIPQLFMAEASLSLTLWQNNMPGAQQMVAATVGIPIIHQLTELNLVATMALPTFAEVGLRGAALFLPLVNLLGASTAETEASLNSARSDGQVYAAILVQMEKTTEPVINTSINGAARVPVLVDTGSSGLVTTADQIGGTAGLVKVGEGHVSYDGTGPTQFHFTSYAAIVDFGGAAVSAPTPVDIVDGEGTDEEKAAQIAEFKAFAESNGVTAILGIGAVALGPGPKFIPTTALPGELSDGFLLYQNMFLGFGVMVLGPNPLPARVSLDGSPYSDLKISINGGPQVDALQATIDSGGVYGTLDQALFPDLWPGQPVPSGTKISAYAKDGKTLLYSWTTSATETSTVSSGGPMNTGYIPFQHGPIYTDYAASVYPDGATIFDYA